MEIWSPRELLLEEFPQALPFVVAPLADRIPNATEENEDQRPPKPQPYEAHAREHSDRGPEDAPRALAREAEDPVPETITFQPSPS